RVHIHHNRIRMLDKQGGGVAIYMQADDSLIERNEITVIPALTMPPIDVPGGGGTVTPTDPCARLEVVYKIKKSLSAYLNLVWQVFVPLLPKAPYKALSGIQLAAGCERVIVLENSIEGGAGNGISLGGSLDQTDQGPPGGPGDAPVVSTFNSVIQGQVAGPDGKPVSGVQLVFTHTATGATLQAVSDPDGSFAVEGAEGKYTVKVASAGYAVDKVTAVTTGNSMLWIISLKTVETQPDNGLGFLYDIRIVRNAIAGMGLCGIGLGPQPLRLSGGFTLAATTTASPLQQFLAVYGNPVLGLVIEANRIMRCLRNPFDEGMRALSQRRGLGGISLGLCEDLDIVDNQIENNGLSHVDPVCGVYVGFSEELQITRNRVVGNGPLAATADNATLQTGVRGGLVVGLASATSLTGVLTAQGQAQASGRPAARIHENLIDQPAGQALTMMAFGPVACSDNSFTAEVSGPRGLDLLAGAVLIYNLGGVQAAPAGTKLQTEAAVNVAAPAQPAPAPASAAGGGDAAKATLFRREYAYFARPAASLRILPGGYTLFADNQSRTGTSNRSFTSHLIAALDDLDYQGHQSYNYRTGNVVANAYLFAGTVRATGNRLSEAGAETLLSLYTLGARMNNTTFNQGDHCIIATDQNPSMAVVQVGNQVLHPSSLCASVNMISDVMFKARG
ncbi:MAG TPA: carboxypeptidase-like regulatory domain-containing protein, partial [Burkholderiales bacterium]|nr:carboxypeptidase-like regulatory domain-containing protein [Burkholderiales bacterium]